MNILEEVFGSVPKVAKFKKVDVTKEQGKALAGNIKNFDEIAKLGDLYQQYLTGKENALLPGYSDTMALGQKGAQQLLSTGEQLLTGELPQDVQDLVQRNSAYTSLQGGFAGSGMSRSLTARDLGLTSLDLMQRGASMIGQGGNSAQQWASLARGDIMNPASSFISPEFQANFDLQNRVLQQQSKQFQYNVDAAPNPVAKGVSDTIMSLVGAYLGGGMGGSKGGGAAAAGTVNYPNYSAYQPPAYQPNFQYDPNAFNNISMGY